MNVKRDHDLLTERAGLPPTYKNREGTPGKARAKAQRQEWTRQVLGGGRPGTAPTVELRRARQESESSREENNKPTKQQFAPVCSLASEDTLITHVKKERSNNQPGDLGMKAGETDSSTGDPGAITPQPAKMPRQPCARTHPSSPHPSGGLPSCNLRWVRVPWLFLPSCFSAWLHAVNWKPVSLVGKEFVLISEDLFGLGCACFEKLKERGLCSEYLKNGLHHRAFFFFFFYFWEGHI